MLCEQSPLKSDMWTCLILIGCWFSMTLHPGDNALNPLGSADYFPEDDEMVDGSGNFGEYSGDYGGYD